jgi:hypothetical protein
MFEMIIIDNTEELTEIYTSEVGHVSTNYMEDELNRPLTDAEIKDIVELILNDDPEISLEFYVDIEEVLHLSDNDDWSRINDCIANTIRWYLKHKTNDNFIKVSSYNDIERLGYEVVEESKQQMDVIFDSNPNNLLKNQVRINPETKSIYLGQRNKLIAFIAKDERK